MSYKFNQKSHTMHICRTPVKHHCPQYSSLHKFESNLLIFLFRCIWSHCTIDILSGCTRDVRKKKTFLTQIVFLYGYFRQAHSFPFSRRSNFPLFFFPGSKNRLKPNQLGRGLSDIAGGHTPLDSPGR